MSAATALRLYDCTDMVLVVDEWMAEHMDQIMAADGEIPPELAELLEQAEGSFKEKAERVALHIKERLATADAIASEAARLTERAMHLRKSAEALKNGYLLRNMERANIPKVEGMLVTVRVQKSPPSVKSSLLEDELWKMSADLRDPTLISVIPEHVVIDKKGVLARWKLGGTLPPGVTVEQSNHLRIS